MAPTRLTGYQTHSPRTRSAWNDCSKRPILWRNNRRRLDRQHCIAGARLRLRHVFRAVTWRPCRLHQCTVAVAVTQPTTRRPLARHAESGSLCHKEAGINLLRQSHSVTVVMEPAWAAWLHPAHGTAPRQPRHVCEPPMRNIRIRNAICPRVLS